MRLFISSESGRGVGQVALVLTSFLAYIERFLVVLEGSNSFFSVLFILGD